jgi:hypothetical protein
VGPLRLPFNGGQAGFKHPAPNPFPDSTNLPATAEALRAAGFKEVFLPQAGGVQSDTVLHVGLVFNVPIGGGSLTLLLPTLSGGLRYETFSRDGVSKVVSVPCTERGVWLFHIEPFVKGDILVSTSR